jgi:hypothetical protein
MKTLYNYPPYQGSALPLSYSSSGRAYAKETGRLQDVFAPDDDFLKCHQIPEQTEKFPEPRGNILGSLFAACSGYRHREV